MKALAFVVGFVAVTACSTTPPAVVEPQVAKVGTVAAPLSLSDSNTIPFPIKPITSFGQDPEVTWDGTLVDLMAADAFAMCSWGGEAPAFPPADRYLAYLELKMTEAKCPNGPTAAMSVENYWIKTRTELPECNYRGSTKQNAVLTLPVVPAAPATTPPPLPGTNANAQWGGADAILYTSAGTIPDRWAGYSLRSVPAIPAMPTGQNPTTWNSAAGRAHREMSVAGTNLCMANRLREQMLSMDMLTASGADQRQLLLVIRERAQVAMLQLAMFGRAFADTSANLVTDAAQYLPILRQHYLRLTAAQRNQLAADLASAVRLEIDVTHELAQLLARSSGARANLADIGGAGFPDIFADVEWGPGGWRGRALDLLYGGDPLGSLLSYVPGAPVSSNWMWGDYAGFGNSWDGERPITASLSRPEVQSLFGLARTADVLYLKRNPAPDPNYDISASADFIWRAVEARLLNQNCTATGGTNCTLKADSPGVPTTASYTDGLLWKRHRVSPEHATLLVQALAQGLPSPAGNFAGRGTFHVAGDLETVAIPQQLTTGSGTWDHLAKDFSFRSLPTATHASPRCLLGMAYMPDSLLGGHYSAAQGFVGDVTYPSAPWLVATGLVNDSLRDLGAVGALAAVRDSLFAGEVSAGAPGGAAPDFYGVSTTAIKQVMGLIESAIGPATLAIRPVLESVTVSMPPPQSGPPLPCGEWANQPTSCTPSPCTCKVLSTQMVGTDTVKATVDLLRPTGSDPVKILLVTAADVVAISGDATNLRHIANLASEPTFKTPAYNLSSATTVENQRIDRSELDTLAECTGTSCPTWSNKAVSSTPTPSPNLGLTRDRYNIQWKVNADGTAYGGAPVLLAVTTTTPKQYVVLADGFALNFFNRGETRSPVPSPAVPVYRSESGYYFSAGGSLGTFAANLLERHPTEWTRPRFDGFGYPIDWTPPVTPELLAGAADPIAFYLSGAKEAAQDATAAVTKALDQVVQESADSQKLQASRERAAGLSTIETQAVCGSGTCPTATSMWSPQLQITCTEPNDYCDILNYTFKAVLPAKMPLLQAVQERLLVDTPPSFSDFAGGSLQTLALDEWTAAKRIQRIVAEAGPRVEKLWHTTKSAKTNADTLEAQFNSQFKSDLTQIANKASEKNNICNNWTLQWEAYLSCFSWKADSMSGKQLGAWLTNPNLVSSFSSESITGFNMGPYWAWQERCRQATTAWSDVMVQLAPQAIPTYGAAVETHIAAQFEAGEATQAIMSSVITALADLQKASVAIGQAIAALGRTQKKLLFDSYLEQSGTASQLAITRRYHQPDMWRARALLDNARRLSVAARRSIESRYNIDLSAILQDEPFVAAPALWADEVYSYDLDPPSAVGVSRTGGNVSGVYANKLVDYVKNLENFVRGYPVLRPTAATSSDTEVISLPGPGATEDVDGSNGIGGTTTSPDATRWSFQCADDGPWLGNPVTAPTGGAALNYTFEEQTAPFKNHGFGAPLDFTVAAGAAPLVQPSIGRFAASLSNGYLATPATQVGESANGFTMSTWVNIRSLCGTCGNQVILMKTYRNNSTWTAPWNSVGIAVDPSSRLLTGVVAVGTTTNYGPPATFVIPQKKWVHLAMTYDGTTLRSYANGAFVNSVSTGTTPRPIDWGTHGNWALGGYPTGTTASMLNAWIGQTRVDPNVRSASEIADEYAKGITDNRAMARWQLNEAAPPFASTGTIPSISLSQYNTAPTTVPAPPFASAVDFNGTGSLVSGLGGPTSAGETPSQITLSAWVYPRTLHTATREIVVKSYGSSWASPWVSVGLSTVTGNPRAMITTAAGAATQVTNGATLPLNQWSYLAMTFDGTTLNLYVNGILSGTSAVPAPPAFIDWGTHGPWMFGGNSLSNAEYFDGRIADVRVEPVVRPQQFLNETYGRGMTGKCFYDTACEAHLDCCEDRQTSPLDTLCPGGRPTRARIQFHVDPWGREDGDIALAPFTARHNVRWGRLAVNLVGTGVRDCTKSDDPLSCYGESFLRYDLSHGGPAWSTDFKEQWHIRDLTIGQIEGGKALATEEWLDPISNSWNQPFVSNVARSELIKRPVSGVYTLDLSLGPDVRAERIRRVQLLMETEYWVSQR